MKTNYEPATYGEYPKMICLASDEQIMSQVYRNQLKEVVRADKKMTQRMCPTLIQHALLIADMKGIKLVKECEIPLIDDIISHERFLRDVMNSDECTDPEAERFLDAFYKLTVFPEIAARFE